MIFFKLFLFFFFINFSNEISSNDFDYIQPNKILKGSIIDLEIYLNEGIEKWDNSKSIKIGDNNIPLENCYSYSSSYYNSIYCDDILLEDDNTEISYGSIVQTGNNLDISFFDEFFIINLDKYLIKDTKQKFYIDTDIAVGFNHRTVKLGNYIVNCSSSYYYYTYCYVKIEEEGTFTLTIDGKEYKLNEGTENERIASITIYEYKIIEFPTFPVNSIEESEELNFCFTMKHYEILIIIFILDIIF